MREPLIFALANEEATLALASSFASALRNCDVRRCLIALQGDLGTGKTTFVRGVLRAFAFSGPVPSPTYTLLEPYTVAGDLLVRHLDLYRLGHPDELEFLGWRDELRAVVFVEWPERAPQLLESADLRVQFEVAGTGRRVRFSAASGLGETLLASLAAAGATNA